MVYLGLDDPAVSGLPFIPFSAYFQYSNTLQLKWSVSFSYNPKFFSASGLLHSFTMPGIPIPLLQTYSWSLSDFSDKPTLISFIRLYPSVLFLHITWYGVFKRSVHHVDKCCFTCIEFSVWNAVLHIVKYSIIYIVPGWHGSFAILSVLLSEELVSSTFDL